MARAGLPVTVLERHTDFAREFRGEGLSPGGQAMFREAGLWDEFDALPHTTFAAMELFFKGRRLLGLDFEWSADATPRFVSQPALLEMLRREAGRFAGFRFIGGARAIAPLLDGGRVVGVTARMAGGHQELGADYVVAADGRHSALRQAVGLDRPKAPQFFDVVWCKLPMPAFDLDRPATMRGAFGNGHFGIFVPSYDGRLQVGWVIAKGTYKDFRRRGIDAWLEEIAGQVWPEMAAHLRATAGQVAQPFLLDVVSDLYWPWAVPGLTLIGDAAHPMSPVGAQGINIALRDAVVAANHIVPALQAGGGDALDHAAQAFAQERLVEVRTIQNMQARAPRFLLSRSKWVDAAAWGIRALDATGLLRNAAKFAATRRHPMVHGVGEVRLTI